jgi:ribosomal protein S18 acetylase RimI-like enzyme
VRERVLPMQMQIVEATAHDDAILVRHFLALLESNGTPAEAIESDAEARILDFIRDGRAHRRLGAFLALMDGNVAGSVACELRRSLYPHVVAQARRRHGYVWNLYVEPAQRRQGVARALMERALAHLRAVGCTAAVLHASAAGERLYTELGFGFAREMRLEL